MSDTINISILGFSWYEQKKIERIFMCSQTRARTYRLSGLDAESPADIFLVSVDAPSAADQISALSRKHPYVPVVSAGNRSSANGSVHHIDGSLISTRVLRVLDQVEITARPDSRISSGLAATHEQPLNGDARPDAASTRTRQYGQGATADGFARQARPPRYRIGDTASYPAVAPVAVAAPPPNANGHTVLVVDDSSSMQKALALELEQVPQIAHVDFADCGEKALERAASKAYDFMFLDVMMPGIDGYETCSTIRKNPAWKKTPIIMLSAKTSPLDEVKGVMAGCTTYLTKPIKHDEFQKLIGRVSRWLDNTKPASP